MPCAHAPRGLTDAKLPWDPDIQNNPCGIPVVTTIAGVDVSAENLCLFHWEQKYGLGAVPSGAVMADVSYAPSGGDDGAAIAALAPDARLGMGSFLAPSGIIFPTKAALNGRGAANYDYTDSLSEIVCSSQTAEAVRCNASPARVEKLGIRNTFAGVPSAGAGLRVPTGGAGSAFRARDVSIKGFYDGVNLAGFQYILDGLNINDCVRYGIYIPTGNTSGDVGDGSIRDCLLWSGPTRAGAAALRWEGGGGMRVSGLKTNATNAGLGWVNGVDISNLISSTGELIFSDCVFDLITGKVVAIDTTVNGLTGVSFDNCLLKGSGNPTHGYYVRGGGLLSHFMVNGGGIHLGTNATSAFDLDSIANATITDVDIGRIPAASPIIKLGGGMNNLKIRLGNLSPPGVSNATTWPTGTYTLLTSGSGNSSVARGGGAVDLEFSWVYPSLTSNSVWAPLWEVSGGSGNPILIELTVFTNSAPGITGSAFIAYHAERLITWNGSILVFTTIGTDVQNVTDLDVRIIASSGSIAQAQAKINPGSTATSLGGWSVLKVRALPTSLKAFS